MDCQLCPGQPFGHAATWICAVGVSHAAHIEEHLPPYWGIITAEELEDGSLDFYVAREAAPNPQLEEERKISLLWRRELNHLLLRNGLPAYAGKSKKSVGEILLERVHPDELAWQMTDELFERDYTTIEQEINAYREAHGEKPKRKRKRKKRTGKAAR